METGHKQIKQQLKKKKFLWTASARARVCVGVNTGLCWFVYSFGAPFLSVKKNATRKYGSINMNDKQQNIRAMANEY